MSYDSGTFFSDALAIGDLNGDGILDLVTGGNHGGSGAILVRLGTGGGSFGTAMTFYSGFGHVKDITLGDLNGDGVLDIAAAGYIGSDGKAAILLGNGNGSFRSPVTYAQESLATFSIRLADFNNDGILDFITNGTTDSLAGEVTVRLGRGDGSFGGALTFAGETDDSYQSAIADLNGDNILDIVTIGRLAGTGITTVRFGTGDGTFTTGTSYVNAVDGRGHAVQLGDLNGDGILDIVTAGYSLTLGTGLTTIQLGQGNGTFGPTVSYVMAEGYRSSDLALGDVNGDGILDVVTAGHDDGSTAGVASIRLGLGNGSLGAITSYATETSASAEVELADLDGDGVLDLITSGQSSIGTTTIRMANTTSGVSPLLSFSLLSSMSSKQALTQFTNALNKLSSQRGEIGAFQARVTIATNVLQNSIENYKAAASRITDADIAAEAAELVRAQILQRAGAAVLAQANQQPALALRLLKGGL